MSVFIQRRGCGIITKAAYGEFSVTAVGSATIELDFMPTEVLLMQTSSSNGGVQQCAYDVVNNQDYVLSASDGSGMEAEPYSYFTQSIKQEGSKYKITFTGSKDIYKFHPNYVYRWMAVG